MTTYELLCAARETKQAAGALTTPQKNTLLHAMADRLLARQTEILSANEQDIAAARGVVPDVMLDRLALNAQRIADMAQGLRAVAALRDPVGTVDSTQTCENGLRIEKVRVPMGVIAVIYESRPNVTADAAALCLKSGNVCILRGGREAIRSNTEIVKALGDALEANGAPRTLVQLVQDTSRDSATELMQARGFVDLLIPRGGAGLIRACVENATVPCIETGTGICHVYVDVDADLDMALKIIDNAKTSRPSVCNAAEVCLVHAAVAERFLPMLRARMTEKNVELRLCSRAASVIDGMPAGEADFDTEFLDYILAVRVVDSAQDAIAHIARHSTGHSEAIVTQNEQTAQTFCALVDSAAVYVNASTRFTEIGRAHV